MVGNKPQHNRNKPQHNKLNNTTETRCNTTETIRNTAKLAQHNKISPIHCVVEISLCCALLGHSTSHISVGDVICRCSCIMPVSLQGQEPIIFSSNLRKCKNLVLVTVADTHLPSHFIRSHNTLLTNPELLQTWLLCLSIYLSIYLSVSGVVYYVCIRDLLSMCDDNRDPNWPS